MTCSFNLNLYRHGQCLTYTKKVINRPIPCDIFYTIESDKVFLPFDRAQNNLIWLLDFAADANIVLDILEEPCKYVYVGMLRYYSLANKLNFYNIRSIFQSGSESRQNTTMSQFCIKLQECSSKRSVLLLFSSLWQRDTFWATEFFMYVNMSVLGWWCLPEAVVWRSPPFRRPCTIPDVISDWCSQLLYTGQFVQWVPPLLQWCRHRGLHNSV